jgi:hypothetical protein
VVAAVLLHFVHASGYSDDENHRPLWLRTPDMEKIKQAIEKARQQAARRVNFSGLPPYRRRRLPRLANSVIGKPASSALNPRHLEKNRIVAMNKSDLSSVSFDLLRTQVLQKMEEHGWRTLAIVSPVPNAAKPWWRSIWPSASPTTRNKTAMLVDFDLRKPKSRRIPWPARRPVTQRGIGRRGRCQRSFCQSGHAPAGGTAGGANRSGNPPKCWPPVR